MRLNYFGLLEENGFVIPKNEASYDETCFQSINDQRQVELSSIVDLAFHDMKYYKKENETLVFRSPDNEYHQIIILPNSILCHIKQCTNSLDKQRDFIIQILEDGSIIFKQLKIYSESIVFTKFVVGVPDYYQRIESFVEGFNKETLDMFKESIPSEGLELNYIELFEKFLAVSNILPDISRKIEVSNKNFKLSVEESDQLSKEYTKSIISILLNTSTSSYYQAIESYIRARDFNQVVSQSKGLTNSLEDEIRLKLKLIYSN